MSDWWATTFEDGGGGEPLRERLVLVRAGSADQAARETGLIREEWRPASGGEVDRWLELCDEPLTERDVLALVQLVRRGAYAIGLDRRKRLARGKDEFARGHSVPRFRARKLAELRGKLEAMGGDA